MWAVKKYGTAENKYVNLLHVSVDWHTYLESKELNLRVCNMQLVKWELTTHTLARCVVETERRSGYSRPLYFREGLKTPEVMESEIRAWFACNTLDGTELQMRDQSGEDELIRRIIAWMTRRSDHFVWGGFSMTGSGYSVARILI